MSRAISGDLRWIYGGFMNGNFCHRDSTATLPLQAGSSRQEGGSSHQEAGPDLAECCHQEAEAGPAGLPQAAPLGNSGPALHALGALVSC